VCNIENEKRTIEIHIRPERRCGELLKEIERAERGRPEKCRTPRHYPTLGSLAINPRAGGSWRQYQGTSRRRSRSLASHPLMALSSGMNLRKIRFMMMLFGCGANVGFRAQWTIGARS